MQSITSRLSRRRLMTLVPISAFGVVVAACGGQSAPPTTASAPAASPTTAAPTQATPAPSVAPASPTAIPTTAPAQMAAATPTPGAAGAADAAPDQTLRLVGWALPPTLSPQLEGGPLRVMTQNTFRSPFILDKDGKLTPGVATDWRVSADGLTYTLTMDPNAKFSDGSKVTAADLKFSWEYLSYPSTKGWSSSYVAGPILGYQDVVDGKTKDMKGIVAKNEGSLEITLAKPYTPFIKSLASYIAGVVKKDNVLAGGDTWDEKPVCCGPYQVDSWNKASGEITWVPNKYWWGQPPKIQKITYRYVKDPNTQSIMYDNNEVDIIVSAADILSAQMKQGPHAKEMQLIPYGGSYFYYFKTQRKPADDVNLRRALMKATDMGKIVQAVFGGAQSPAYGIISPNLDGFSNPKPYFDPDGAKQALAASAFKTAANVPPITIAVGTNLQEYIRVSEAVQQMWKDVLGISVTVKPYDKATDPSNDAAQIFRASLGTLVNDTSAAVSAQGLSSSSYMKDNVGLKNDQLDEILTKADSLSLEQQGQRIELYRQAEKIMLDQAYYIPIIWVQYYHIVKPWVKSFATNIDLSLYDLNMYLAKH